MYSKRIPGLLTLLSVIASASPVTDNVRKASEEEAIREDADSWIGNATEKFTEDLQKRARAAQICYAAKNEKSVNETESWKREEIIRSCYSSTTGTEHAVGGVFAMR